jgi:hypothetical protein
MGETFYFSGETCVVLDFSEVELQPGGEATIAVIPPEPVRLGRVVIPADLAPRLMVTFMAVAGRRQDAGEFPAVLFSEVSSLEGFMLFEACPARHLIELRLRNTTQEPVLVSGCQAILRRP